MGRYLIRRLLLTIPTIVGVSFLVFVILRLTPGDVAEHLLAESMAAHDPQMEAKIRKDVGLEGSIPTQYLRWTSDVLTGDLGSSYYTGRSVRGDLAERLPVSFQLGAMAILVSVVVGIPIGLISAIRQDSWLDYLTRGGAILFLAVPAFWMALIVLQVGRQQFQWAPPALYHDLWENPLQNIYMMLTPAIILGVNLAAVQARYLRTQMLEVMRQDYIRTAWAKGLSSRVVIVRHAVRNALVPVVTVIGLQVPTAVTGVLILEIIFLIPGVGRLLIEAARRADYPIVQGVTLFVAITVVTVNLIIDLSYTYLDPRVKAAYR